MAQGNCSSCKTKNQVPGASLAGFDCGKCGEPLGVDVGAAEEPKSPLGSLLADLLASAALSKAEQLNKESPPPSFEPAPVWLRATVGIGVASALLFFAARSFKGNGNREVSAADLERERWRRIEIDE